MNWTDLAPIIAPAAPTLGRLLGNVLPIPFGGSIGEAAGAAIAAAMGVEPNPDKVAATAGATHNDVLIAQLAEAEGKAKAQWQAIAVAATAEGQVGAAEVTAIGTTQRAELVSGEWYQRWWRPLAMFVWVGTWPVQLGTILYHIGSRDPAAIQNLAAVVQSLAIWNAGPAALAGVYSWGRTKEKLNGGA